MRILLIEPDRILADTLATALKDYGHDVQVKSSAQTGLDGVDSHDPEVIILEIQLGKHNGVEFLYELRSHSDWVDVPVVIHTANPDALIEEYSAGWKELGVKKILYKHETSMDKLNKAITKLQQ